MGDTFPHIVTVVQSDFSSLDFGIMVYGYLISWQRLRILVRKIMKQLRLSRGLVKVKFRTILLNRKK